MSSSTAPDTVINPVPPVHTPEVLPPLSSPEAAPAVPAGRIRRLAAGFGERLLERARLAQEMDESLHAESSAVSRLMASVGERLRNWGRGIPRTAEALPTSTTPPIGRARKIGQWFASLPGRFVGMFHRTPRTAGASDTIADAQARALLSVSGDPLEGVDGLTRFLNDDSPFSTQGRVARLRAATASAFQRNPRATTAPSEPGALRGAVRNVIDSARRLGRSRTPRTAETSAIAGALPASGDPLEGVDGLTRFLNDDTSLPTQGFLGRIRTAFSSLFQRSPRPVAATATETPVESSASATPGRARRLGQWLAELPGRAWNRVFHRTPRTTETPAEALTTTTAPGRARRVGRWLAGLPGRAWNRVFHRTPRTTETPAEALTTTTTPGRARRLGRWLAGLPSRAWNRVFHRTPRTTETSAIAGALPPAVAVAVATQAASDETPPAETPHADESAPSRAEMTPEELERIVARVLAAMEGRTSHADASASASATAEASASVAAGSSAETAAPRAELTPEDLERIVVAIMERLPSTSNANLAGMSREEWDSAVRAEVARILVEMQESTPHVDVPRVDVPRVDVPRVDVPRVETPRVETPAETSERPFHNVDLIAHLISNNRYLSGVNRVNRGMPSGELQVGVGTARTSMEGLMNSRIGSETLRQQYDRALNIPNEAERARKLSEIDRLLAERLILTTGAAVEYKTRADADRGLAGITADGVAGLRVIERAGRAYVG